MVAELGSQVLCMLNPMQAIQVAQQVAGLRDIEARVVQDDDGGASYETVARYTLPFAGRWLVGAGGMTPQTSHSWEILGQRFALDFVQADDDLRRHTGRGTKRREYFCYDAPILAAADGIVMAVENRIGPSPFLGWCIRDFTSSSAVGNYVMIEHAPGEYALYAHLIRGSLTVRVGTEVRRGEVIGRCGHTGHSSEPHLHFHLQDSAGLWKGMGLPVRFHDLLVDGRAEQGVHLTAGCRVESAA